MALLQAAPVSVDIKENGRFAIAIGVGGDRYTQERFSCDGSTLESRTVASKTVSGTYNVPLRGSWSLDGFGGNTTTDGPVCADPACSLPPAFKGGFGAVRLRVESGDAALAVGLASLPAVDIDYTAGTHEISRDLLPTVLLRIGTINPGRKHFRAELNGVPTPGALPLNTFGLGVTGRDSVPANVFIGLAIPAYSTAENGNLLVRGELQIPLGRRAELNVGASMNTSIFTGSGGIRLRW